jgi:hypothetical protein
MPKEIIPVHEWNALPVDGRLQRLLGMTLDECCDILTAPIDWRNAPLMNSKDSVRRAVLHTCMKLGMRHQQLELQRDRMLSELTHKMRGGKGLDPLDEPVDER